MNEENNGTHTKVAVLSEKVDNLEDNIMFKLHQNEKDLKSVHGDIKDIQNKLKYILIVIVSAFGLAQGGMFDMLKEIIK